MAEIGISAMHALKVWIAIFNDLFTKLLSSLFIGIPVVPTDVAVEDIAGDFANISWIISRVAIIRESYYIMYGLNSSNLNMYSDEQSSQDLSFTNQSYTVVLENLNGYSTYYYQVVSENDFSSSTTEVYSFTTLEDGNNCAKYNM